MKIRKRKLAKPGIYGSVENPQIVNEKDLREIAETFPEITKAPISMNGHWPDPSKPRLGNVVALSFDETSKVLSGDVEEQDALFQAVEEGFYPDVSIGAKRRASDGKMYLHHLAYLGEEPPAIKDLIKNLEESFEHPESQEEIAAAEESKDCLLLPSPQAKKLLLSDPEASHPSKPQTPKTKEESMNLEEALAALETEKKKVSDLTTQNQSYKDQLSKLAEKYPDSEITLADAENPQVKMLTQQLRADKVAGILQAAQGKLPKAKQGLLSALTRQLSVGQTLELSDAAGNKETLSGFEALRRVFEAIPLPVEPGRLDLEDPAQEKTPDIDMAEILKRV